MEYQKGHNYPVPCAQIRLKEDGQEYAIPVIDQPHTDPQFNFPHRHYHIDGRFAIHPRMRHRLQITEGHTRSVILPDGSDSYDFIGLTVQYLTCERLETGLLFAAHSADLAVYEQWYQGYIGQTCKGRRCPHLGAAMLAQGGLLVCPMHHLTADAATKRIIERTS